MKVGRDQRAKLNVLGFGGGVSELFLMLAKHEGHRAFFCSGSPARRDHLEAQGIEPIDQKAFNRFTGKDDVKAFNKHVKGLTERRGLPDRLRHAARSRCTPPVSRSSAGWA